MGTIARAISPQLERLMTHARDIEQIIELVRLYYGVSMSELMSKSRFTMPVTARQMVCALAQDLFRLKYDDIGFFVRRDRATVRNGILVVKQSGGELRADYERFLRTIKSGGIEAEIERLKTKPAVTVAPTKPKRIPKPDCGYRPVIPTLQPIDEQAEPARAAMRRLWFDYSKTQSQSSAA